MRMMTIPRSTEYLPSPAKRYNFLMRADISRRSHNLLEVSVQPNRKKIIDVLMDSNRGAL